MKIIEYNTHNVIDCIEHNNKFYFYIFVPTQHFQISIAVKKNKERIFEDTRFKIHELVNYFDTEDFYPLVYLYCKTNENTQYNI